MAAVNKPLRQFSPFKNFQRFIESQPLAKAEESIPLRLLVQLLVFIGIAATDVAATTNNSVWAIPLSAIGAGWGWYARHRRNISVKFCIAIAMIVILVVFLGDLIRQTEETRLLLARLLIQLQVLHSFDLPRRKDLGYSTVIGLILLGVAGTLSQTMIFGVWLLLFLAIALPVLILDHRSRLGVSTRKLEFKSMGIAPLPMLGLLVAVLVLGLSIFALLPRLPGFQLRNFPVSGNVNIQRQIPAGGIVTPGRTRRQGQGGGGANNNDGTGGDAATEPSVLPPLFGTEIDETKNVPLKPEVVMRVRSQAELFWRVLAYDEYTGKGWRISRNDKSQIRTLRRQIFGYEYYVPDAPGLLLKGGETRDVVQTYTIVAENLPNLIPAAFMPNRLYFPSEEVDFDLEGGLRAPGALPPDLTYTVISAVPFRDRTALGKASQKYPTPIRSFYLKVPSQIELMLRDKALEILDKATNVVGNKKLDFDNPYDKALYLAQTLKQRYRIQDLQFNSTGNTPNNDLVLQFLKQGGGQPSHFVSTMVLMLRSLGIPARYMVGFDPGKFNPFTGLYEVMNTDAHSMVEVFFPRHGWVAFDPVPGRDLFPSSIEEDKTFGVLQSFWNWVAGFLPSPVVGFLTVVFNAIGRWLSSATVGLINWLITLGWAGFIVGALVLFSVAIGLWGIWQVVRWWLDLLRLRKLEPAHRTYQLMLRFLDEKGMHKSPHQTPQEYALQVTNQVHPQQANTILEITQAYQDWRYGGRRHSERNRASSWSYLKALLQKLQQRPRR
jgi:protein-glutamine gamma-glutamyltransferase